MMTRFAEASRPETVPGLYFKGIGRVGIAWPRQKRSSTFRQCDGTNTGLSNTAMEPTIGAPCFRRT